MIIISGTDAWGTLVHSSIYQLVKLANQISGVAGATVGHAFAKPLYSRHWFLINMTAKVNKLIVRTTQWACCALSVAPGLESLVCSLKHLKSLEPISWSRARRWECKRNISSTRVSLHYSTFNVLFCSVDCFYLLCLLWGFDVTSGGLSEVRFVHHYRVLSKCIDLFLSGNAVILRSECMFTSKGLFCNTDLLWWFDIEHL